MPVEGFITCHYEFDDGRPCQLELGHAGDHDPTVASFSVETSGQVSMSGELSITVIRKDEQPPTE